MDDWKLKATTVVRLAVPRYGLSVRFHYLPWLACRSAVACFQLLCYNLWRPLSLKHRIVIVLCNWLINGRIVTSLLHSRGVASTSTSQVPVPVLEVDIMLLLSYFSFRIHCMDFPDCLLLLLSISVFLLFSFFLLFTLFSCRFRAVD